MFLSDFTISELWIAFYPPDSKCNYFILLILVFSKFFALRYYFLFALQLNFKLGSPHKHSKLTLVCYN